MHGYMYGWKTKLRSRAILSAYRGQNQTLWNRKEQQEAQDEYGKKCTKHNTFFDNDDSDEFAGPDMRNS